MHRWPLAIHVHAQWFVGEKRNKYIFLYAHACVVHFTAAISYISPANTHLLSIFQSHHSFGQEEEEWAITATTITNKQNWVKLCVISFCSSLRVDCLMYVLQLLSIRLFVFMCIHTICLCCAYDRFECYWRYCFRSARVCIDDSTLSL